MQNPDGISIIQLSAKAFMDEQAAVHKLLSSVEPLEFMEEDIMRRAAAWTKQIRTARSQHGIEEFLKTYSLNTAEGVALMCLAEALLRIPDAETADALIRDTFEGREWGHYTESSSSWLVSISSWGLLLTGKITDFGSDGRKGIVNTLKSLVARAGEPLIREALKQAMKFIGSQFVLAETIEEAISSGKNYTDKGYRFSYDMLGEGARNDKQSKNYIESYLSAIEQIGKNIDKTMPFFERPGISIKLSALHPRYILVKRGLVMQELLPRLKNIVQNAKEAGIAVAIDAEESSRLDIELLLFEELLKDQKLAGWNGIGFVLQAYQKRAFYIIDWLARQAKLHNRVIPLRLVKGAYWDSEIKWAQMQGLPSYPVFTRKEHTDLSYLACANKILSNHDFFYPQFATHNSRTISSIVSLGEKYGWQKGSFEFQRLYGMGEALHDILVKDFPSRIYAPIGRHKDLLAYLIRRLLENGANSSFVHLLADDSKSDAEILADPISVIKKGFSSPEIPLPKNLYASQRNNSAGIDFGNAEQLKKLQDGIAQFLEKPIATIKDADTKILQDTIFEAEKSFQEWSETSVNERAAILDCTADLIEKNAYELISLCIREAGKTQSDSVAEIREAADFCRYYAQQARTLMQPDKMVGPAGESNVLSLHPRGIFACISPWNFPLAIFMGQVAAALVTGNCVIAKPAEQTPQIAARAVEILYEAGIPRSVLHLVCGGGDTIGAALVANKNIAGVVFTGSLETAQLISLSLAKRGGAIIPFIAETGGQNCMVVDSSALLEQAVDDIIISAFGSTGQRCSSLRVLYVQEDIADELIGLLTGAMQELKVGDPAEADTDIGPVIDLQAQNMLLEHIKKMKNSAKLKGFTWMPMGLNGFFIPPHTFEISSIAELEHEIFGPILHIIRFKAGELEEVVDSVNSTGYGLTFGIHSRINDHIELLASKVKAGNIYVNRSMIGATVGVQPFGGEGLSGTGPKAGGPHYLLRFLNERTITINSAAIGGNVSLLTGNGT